MYAQKSAAHVANAIHERHCGRKHRIPTAIPFAIPPTSNISGEWFTKYLVTVRMT